MTERIQQRWAAYHGLTVCVLAGLLLLIRGVDNGFRDDDFVFLNHVAQHRALSDLLAPSPAFAFYRPGAILLFALESHCFGTDATGYLGFNIGLHLVNAWLLASVLERLGLARVVAIWSATLFALGVGHYCKEVLWACTSGGLAAVICMLAALRCILGSNARRRLLLSLVGITIAPLLHEMGLVAPVLVLAGLATRTDSTRALRYAPLLLLPAVLWVGVLLTLSASHPAYDLGPNVARAPQMITKYIGFMVMPLQDSQLGAAPLLRAVASFTLIAASVWAWRRGSAVSRLIAAWPYVVLAPFALVPLPGGWIEMRYLYCAAMPYCVLFAALTTRALHRTTRPIRLVIATAVVCTLAFEWEMERRWDALGRSWSGSLEQEGARARAGKQASQDPRFEIACVAETRLIEQAPLLSRPFDRNLDRDRCIALVGHENEATVRCLPRTCLHAGR